MEAMQRNMVLTSVQLKTTTAYFGHQKTANLCPCCLAKRSGPSDLSGAQFDLSFEIYFHLAKGSGLLMKGEDAGEEGGVFDWLY